MNPDNVAEAVSILHPSVVDVSSGVCDETGLNKDPAKVKQWGVCGKGVMPL